MRKFFTVLIAAIIGFTILVPTPVFAVDDNCVETSILGNGGQVCDNSGKGESIIKILTTIIDVMTVGIGVLGVIGITIVGIQYLTAGGSEEKTRKAKRRMFEIVIGLVAYVLIYALLKWLMPGMK